ncbi:MAG: rRNA maturation RNase YbeY [Burkholderiales bacterium]|nr:rRNA maturation RNase YbeY [Burkholderiales bacterium]
MIKFSYRRYNILDGQLTRSLVDKIVRRSLCNKYQNVILNIEIVDIETSQALNLEYRGKDYPTNVISLEYPEMRDKFNMLSGDLILSHDVILKEALEQNKSIEHHYLHMLVHGLLHLQGYDHIDDKEANEMEQIEIDILKTFQINNPYTNL